MTLKDHSTQTIKITCMYIIEECRLLLSEVKSLEMYSGGYADTYCTPNFSIE
jgi:hypothetical protein